MIDLDFQMKYKRAKQYEARPHFLKIIHGKKLQNERLGSFINCLNTIPDNKNVTSLHLLRK